MVGATGDCADGPLLAEDLHGEPQTRRGAADEGLGAVEELVDVALRTTRASPHSSHSSSGTNSSSVGLGDDADEVVALASEDVESGSRRSGRARGA